jgi:hypothetical protein
VESTISVLLAIFFHIFGYREECERVKGQLSAISKDMKEDCQQNRNRGFHM